MLCLEASKFAMFLYTVIWGFPMIRHPSVHIIKAPLILYSLMYVYFMQCILIVHFAYDCTHVCLSVAVDKIMMLDWIQS